MVDNFNHSQKVQNCPKSPKFKFGVLGTSSNGPLSRKKSGNQNKPFSGPPWIYLVYDESVDAVAGCAVVAELEAAELVLLVPGHVHAGPVNYPGKLCKSDWLKTHKGSSRYDVREIYGFLTPLPPCHGFVV